MPTSTKVKNLNINELTEAQYDAAVQGGVIGANELSVLTDVNYVEPGDLATVATTGDYSDLINRPTNLVSTNTAQTISGMKTFSGDITLSGTTSIKNNTGGTNYTMLYRDASTIHVGASTSALKLEGSGTRPAYNNDSLALLSDITGGLPSQAGHSGEFLTTDGTDASWSDKPVVNRATGVDALAIGTAATSATNLASIAIGQSAVCTGERAIQFGYGTNNENNTMKVSLGYDSFTNYKLLDSDGTIPEARLADTTNAAQGQVLALDSNLDAVWTTLSGGGLPDQTGNAGKFLTTDGTDASWGAEVDKIQITQTVGNIWEIGNNSLGGIVIRRPSDNKWFAFLDRCIKCTPGMDLGDGVQGFNKVFLERIINRTVYPYKEIIVPGVAGTMAVIQVNTAITLTAADWSSNTQTVSVTGMTATGIVMVSPDPTDQSAYTSAGIICSAQAAGTLTFTCSTTPTADLSVNVVML